MPTKAKRKGLDEDLVMMIPKQTENKPDKPDHADDETEAAIAALDAAEQAIRATRHLLKARRGTKSDVYLSADNPGPYLTSRAFLDAGRRGDFPTRRVGRRVVALASDVYAAIEAKPPKKPAPKSTDPLAKYDAKGRAA